MTDRHPLDADAIAADRHYADRPEPDDIPEMDEDDFTQTAKARRRMQEERE